MATFTSRNHRLSDLLLLLAFLALPLTLGELITPALADFLGKKLIALPISFCELYSRKICLSSCSYSLQSLLETQQTVTQVSLSFIQSMSHVCNICWMLLLYTLDEIGFIEVRKNCILTVKKETQQICEMYRILSKCHFSRPLPKLTQCVLPCTKTLQ